MMYGEEKLNDHYVLRYGLTKEFFETFHSLRYLGLELPLTLVRKFHIHIKSYVNANLTHRSYIRTLREKHGLKTMKDVQHSLARYPQMKRNLAQVAHRKMILLPGRLAPFALEQLSSLPVMFIISNQKDQKALQDLQLPQHMQTFHFFQRVKRQGIPQQKMEKITKKAKHILNAQRQHPLFGKASFKKWLLGQLKSAMKTVKTLNRLIRKHPIKVIVDHVEITNPGTTLSLLARKFYLPFVNIPQVLISDRSLLPTRATHYCVWGQHYKQWLQKRGIEWSRILETGNLGFAYVRNDATSLQHIPKKKMIKQLNIPDDHFIVTYTTQPFVKGVNRQIIRWVKQSLHPALPLTLIIRPHPYDKTDYVSLFKGTPNTVVDQEHLSLYDILSNTDFMMTISSNTAIEAALFGKGIFVLQPNIPYDYEHHNNEFNAHLVKASAGPPIFNHSDLATHWQRAVQQPTYRASLRQQSKQFLEKTLNMKQTPSSRIGRLIKRLADS